jgi:cell division protein FtsI (penicillin-binding protein 3)
VADAQRRRFRFRWSPSTRAGARPAAARDWRRTVQRRLLVFAVIIGAWTAAIEARLFQLQVVQYDDLVRKAEKQQTRTVAAPAKRGDILDRTGRVLAYSVDAESVVADPSAVEEPDATAAALCRVLDGCGPEQRQLMARRLRGDAQFAWLARKVTSDEARQVRGLELPGIGFVNESRRFYPNSDLAAQVLGYVGLDNVGLAGLEAAYDTQVRGKEGQVLVQNDARQQVLFSRVERPPTAGATLELTLDYYLQYIAERELKAGVEENRAAAGTALIMDPASGEILALANYPTFNPNVYNRSGASARRNRAVQDLYEPGSTFKIVTASAALEEHVIDPADPVDCAPGHITFGSRVIRDTHAYGVLPFADVIVKSSNVGAIKVGLQIGPERLTEYINRFGFGHTVSPDFRGESPGIVWSADRLTTSALASVSMGYQVGVTPLQMAAAVSSIANGGTLYQPRVVRALVSEGHRIEVPHEAVRRTISPSTAAELTAIMEQVVERGTARSAQIDGYTIAGKTGTAQKLVDGRYSRSDYNASFVGFVPSRRPALTIIVVIDSPHAKGYFGGTVAAPIFKRIAEASLRHLGVAPTLNAAPPVVVARGQEEKRPSPLVPVSNSDADRPRPMTQADAGHMPDLQGLSARDAIRILTRLGLTAAVAGTGVVVEQEPDAGVPLSTVGNATLTLGRRPPAVEERGSPR